MPLKIQDGYTLKGETTGKGFADDIVPVVKIEYRPPTTLEMHELRYDLNAAKSGAEQHARKVAFLLARLVKWDVIGADDRPVPIVAEIVAKVPDPIFSDLMAVSSTWKAKDDRPPEKQQAEAAGNS